MKTKSEDSMKNKIEKQLKAGYPNIPADVSGILVRYFELNAQKAIRHQLANTAHHKNDEIQTELWALRRNPSYFGASVESARKREARIAELSALSDSAKDLVREADEIFKKTLQDIDSLFNDLSATLESMNIGSFQVCRDLQPCETFDSAKKVLYMINSLCAPPPGVFSRLGFN